MHLSRVRFLQSQCPFCAKRRSITSDYDYRGYTLSDHKPSVSTNFEAYLAPSYAGEPTTSTSSKIL